MSHLQPWGESMLIVIAAAVLHNGKIYTMPPPKRHHNIIQAMSRTEGLERVTQAQQGFRLCDNSFATREEARKVADAAGQTSERDMHHEKLYSEDLW